jgi:hypothetical protein
MTFTFEQLDPTGFRVVAKLPAVSLVKAGADLLATAGGFLWFGLENAFHSVIWPSVAFGSALAAASVGITRKNVFAQVVSRGFAWIVFAPTAAVMAIELLHGRMQPELTGFALSSGLALFLARPMLDGDEARAQFAPSKFRRSFLAACTATMTIGLVSVALEEETSFGGKARVLIVFGTEDQKTYELKQWTITDPQGLDTTVAVSELDTATAPDEKLFAVDYTRYKR